MLDKPELDRKSGNGCWEESVRDREPGKRVSMLIVMLDDKRNAVQHHQWYHLITSPGVNKKPLVWRFYAKQFHNLDRLVYLWQKVLKHIDSSISISISISISFRFFGQIFTFEFPTTILLKGLCCWLESVWSGGETAHHPCFQIWKILWDEIRNPNLKKSLETADLTHLKSALMSSGGSWEQISKVLLLSDSFYQSGCWFFAWILSSGVWTFLLKKKPMQSGAGCTVEKNPNHFSGWIQKKSKPLNGVKHIIIIIRSQLSTDVENLWIGVLQQIWFQARYLQHPRQEQPSPSQQSN